MNKLSTETLLKSSENYIDLWSYLSKSTKSIVMYGMGNGADKILSVCERYGIAANMLAAGEKMFAYPFEGYWKDVGTISSLWEANMDLLGDQPVLDLSGNDWRIFARHSASAPQFVGARASIENCYITEGCEIYGTVKNSVIGPGVKVMAGAHVEDCVLMGDCVIEAGATVQYAIIDSDVTVGAGATVGAARATGAEIAVVGEGITIAAGTTVEPGAMLSE